MTKNTHILAAYQKRISAGTLQPDPAQALAIDQLALLEQRLDGYDPHTSDSSFFKIFKKHKHTPNGLYIYGGVGRGKSLLMDCFYAALTTQYPARRVHFHTFMHEVHQQLNIHRESQHHDPLTMVADNIVRKNWLLCFDEFFVADITDAMILGRLFQLMFARGVVVVATSNIAIQDLYANGLQRGQFLPFIATFQQKMQEHHLNSPHDYRSAALHTLPRYFVSSPDSGYTAAYNALIAHLPKTSLDICAYGRTLTFDDHHRGLVRSSFDALCRDDLGTADYLQVAAASHIVFLDNVPCLSGADNDSIARRFLHLIDCLYEARCQLFMDLHVPLAELYTSGRLNFEFQRCLSRLNEMQSTDYARQVSIA